MADTLSVVILNYRTPESVIRAIRSLSDGKKADTHPLEIVVVDNGSGDDSVEKITNGRSGAKVVSLAENRGFAAGMNAGIAETSGQYILLLNSDICVQPGSLEALLRHMAESPKTGLVAPLLVRSDGRPCRTLLIEPTAARMLIPLLAKIRYYQWRSRLNSLPVNVEATEGAAVMVRQSALDKVGLLDERFFFYSEVVDWCMRFRRSGYLVQVLPTARMTHARGASTARVYTPARIELKRSEYQLVRKYLGSPACAFVISRDILAESLRTACYALLSGVSLGRIDHLAGKLRSHAAVLVWLIAGRPGREDNMYIALFGRWD